MSVYTVQDTLRLFKTPPLIPHSSPVTTPFLSSLSRNSESPLPKLTVLTFPSLSPPPPRICSNGALMTPTAGSALWEGGPGSSTPPWWLPGQVEGQPGPFSARKSCHHLTGLEPAPPSRRVMAQGEGKRGFAPHSLGIIQTGPELGGGLSTSGALGDLHGPGGGESGEGGPSASSLTSHRHTHPNP